LISWIIGHLKARIDAARTWNGPSHAIRLPRGELDANTAQMVFRLLPRSYFAGATESTATVSPLSFPFTVTFCAAYLSSSAESPLRL
jgi:hypothetical protein